MSMKPDAPFYRSIAHGQPGVRIVLAGHPCHVRVYGSHRVITDDHGCQHDIVGAPTRQQLSETLAVYFEECEK